MYERDHMNIRIAQPKLGGATSFGSICAKFHHLGILEVYNDKRTILWRVMGQNFRFGADVVNQPSHDFSCLHISGLASIFYWLE